MNFVTFGKKVVNLSVLENVEPLDLAEGEADRYRIRFTNLTGKYFDLGYSDDEKRDLQMEDITKVLTEKE